MDKSNKPLRFAIFARVSTEQQNKEGYSLEDQEKQLEILASNLGGIIPANCRYIGQEHTSYRSKRDILDKLLFDAKNSLFDAVIFYNIQRIGRNNIVLQQALDKLQEYKIRIFFQNQEHYRFNPEEKVNTNIQGAFSEYHADSAAKRSLEVKISLAARGWPEKDCIWGRIPTNVENKRTEPPVWEIDQVEYDRMQKAYQLYVIDGLSIRDAAAKVDLEFWTLHRYFDKCGPDYEITFDVPRFGIKESFHIKVPALLTQEQLDRLADRRAENRKNFKQVNDFLLSGRVRCMHCGSTMPGSSAYKVVNAKGDKRYYRYYRHAATAKDKTPLCKKNVPAEELENRVLSAIGGLFNNQKKLEQAIRKAIGTVEPRKADTSKQLHAIDNKLKEFDKEVESIVDEMLTKKGKTKAVRAMLDRRAEQIQNEIDSLTEKKKALETTKKKLSIRIPKDLSKRVRNLVYALTHGGGHIVRAWPDEEKKALIDLVFGSKRSGLGVRVGYQESERFGNYFDFELKGIIGAARATVGGSELTDWQDFENSDIDPDMLRALINAIEAQPAMPRARAASTGKFVRNSGTRRCSRSESRYWRGCRTGCA